MCVCKLALFEMGKNNFFLSFATNYLTPSCSSNIRYQNFKNRTKNVLDFNDIMVFF
jgi:hypothetical protein